MNILDNPLVKKYFGCQHDERSGCCWEHQALVAQNVLQAMQEPIRKGERYLQAYDMLGTLQIDHWDEKISQQNFGGFHTWSLRLPDKFQKRECECLCHRPEDHHAVYKCTCQPQRDEVEENIFEMAINRSRFSCKGGTTMMVEELRELVRVARMPK